MVRTPTSVTHNEVPAEKGKLKATIPFPILLMLGINAIIGTGIFFVPGIAAKLAGPGSLIAWTAVAILALIISDQAFEVREDIYKKRHFTVDIPSMYGSYHEKKFDALFNRKNQQSP